MSFNLRVLCKKCYFCYKKWISKRFIITNILLSLIINEKYYETYAGLKLHAVKNMVNLNIKKTEDHYKIVLTMVQHIHYKSTRTSTFLKFAVNN